MTSVFFVRRSIRAAGATIAASIVFAGCKGDSLTASYSECSGEPGCQSVDAPVATEVLQSLDDADTRVTASLSPAIRVSIDASLSRIKVALQERKLDAGRTAFVQAIEALNAAELATPESAPDLCAIRLGLVPAARSLGLPVSAVEAPSR